MTALQPHHPMLRRRAIVIALAACAAGTLRGEAPWPNKPIRIVVAGAPGGGADPLMRVIGQQMAKTFKQPVIVDNKPGGNGVLSAKDVLASPADGHTLLFTAAAFTVMAQAMPGKPPYDVTRDLAPVAQVGAGGIYLVTSNDFPAANMKEFVAHVKANPGRYNYASFGIGSSGHLVMAALQNRHGLELNHVPYKAMTGILGDLQNGNVPIAFVDTVSSTPLIKAGKIKVMGVSGTGRTVALPDVPTLTEQGFKFDTDGWYGVFAPAGTPAPVIAALNAEINRIVVSPELKERFAQLNLANPPLKSPEQFGQTVRDDLKVWSRIVQDNRITPES
ncbi:MAG: tripartite tricarboxylate transporter substrate binding protein [Burkholderiaceae bacterium]